MASRKGAKQKKELITSAERQAQIDVDVQNFLANGGEILSIPEGVSGEPGWHGQTGAHRPDTRVHIQSPISYGQL